MDNYKKVQIGGWHKDSKRVDCALVDAEDYPLISRFKWSVTLITKKAPKSYAYISYGAIRMHRLILGLPDRRLDVDHINGNTLDNRKCNLRICTTSQNCMNRVKKKNGISQYKGVRPANGGWRACIRVNGRNKHLGKRDTEIEAARLYDEAAIKHYKEFASINFPTVNPFVNLQALRIEK